MQTKCCASITAAACTVLVPNRHQTSAALTSKFSPITVTAMPPRAGPKLGVSPCTSGTALYANCTADEVKCSALLLISTATTIGAATGGAVQVSAVGEIHTAGTIAASPNLQLSAPLLRKFVPTTVTA